MDWRAKVELFEEIRREYEFGIGTIAGVAKKLKVHRRMVREAIGNALLEVRHLTREERVEDLVEFGFSGGMRDLAERIVDYEDAES